MSRESSPPLLSLLFIIIIVAVTVSAFPTAVRSHPDLIRLPSDHVSLCPTSVTPGSCPVKCFRTVPVCGVNNVTYWCGCAEALCAGTRVVKLGFCEFENGGIGPVSGQALLLVHIVWLILLGFFVLFGLL